MDEDDLTYPPADPPSIEAEAAEVKQLFQMISYQSPLPPPAILEAYERILPGSAERIFDRMEREGDHRHWIERTTLQADVGAQQKGQWFAFVIALIGLSGGFGLILNGSSALGLAVFFITLASFAAVFIYGKKRQEKVLEKQLKHIKELMPRAITEGSTPTSGQTGE
jgi:uncharacterized membrane protein